MHQPPPRAPVQIQKCTTGIQEVQQLYSTVYRRTSLRTKHAVPCISVRLYCSMLAQTLFIACLRQHDGIAAPYH